MNLFLPLPSLTLIPSSQKTPHPNHRGSRGSTDPFRPFWIWMGHVCSSLRPVAKRGRCSDRRMAKKGAKSHRVARLLTASKF